MADKSLNRKYGAHTLAETMIVLIIFAFLTLISLSVFGNANPKVIKLKIKNANFNFKNSVNNILSNPILYSPEGDLTDISAVSIEGVNGEAPRYYSSVEKFRDLMYRELAVSDLNIKCYYYSPNRTIETSNHCAAADNGLIWYIPNTNFGGIDASVEPVGIMEAVNPSGSTSFYTPVTLYPDAKHLSSVADFEKYAVVLGVRRDGSVIILPIPNLPCDSKSENNHCRALDYLTSSTVTQER